MLRFNDILGVVDPSQSADTLLERAVEMAQGNPANLTVVVKGFPRKGVPALARCLEADLLVIGTVARTGVPAYLIGKTAEAILQQAECSVLAVKPEGFATNVTLD